ncbi:MAG: BACON domain-containing protein [Prevotella sp.]
MKKISVLFLTIAVLFVTVSCSDDTNNPYAKDAQVTVLNSNMVLDAVASEGVITFSANGTATASCAQSWCTVDVENNNTVRVKSTQNNYRESRSTLVIICCNGDSVQVPVVQRGAELIFSESALPAVTNDAQTLECHITTNMPISILSTPDWVAATLSSETGMLALELDANATGDYRRGWVKLHAGEFEDSIEVLQYDFDQQFAGNYYLNYNDKNGAAKRLPVTVSKTAIDLSAFKMVFPVTFNAQKISLVLKSGQKLGSRANDNFYNIFYNNEENRWSAYSTQASMQFVFGNETDETTGDKVVRARFTPVRADVVFDVLAVHTFSPDSLKESCDGGVYQSMKMFNPYLEKR